jgi:anti-sigma factor RsiW
MKAGHLDIELIPYLRGELAADERERVSHHLAQCASCRGDLEETRETIAALCAQISQPPEVDWRRYRAELRRKLDERSARRSGWSLPRLVPVAATAAVAGLAVFLTLRGVLPRSAPDEDIPPFEQTEIGSRLDLLQNYSVVENLDLFDDFEIVQHLDDLDGAGRVQEG